MSDCNEDIFSGIPLGKWNLVYILIVCLQQASSPAHYYSSIFVNMPIAFRCRTNLTRPSNITFDNSCSVTDENIENAEYGVSLHKCTSYEFDTSLVSSTFTSEFHLVCDKAWVSWAWDMTLPLGSFIGTFFLGASDKWGRVTLIQISSTIQAGGSLILKFAGYDYLVILGRFLVGLSYPILTGSAKTLFMETISPKHRSIVGFMMSISFYIFVMLLGIVAYFIRDWRLLYSITSSPMYLIPLLALLLDKSPRWLIQQGRLDEAFIVMQKAARLNNGTVNFDLTSIKIESSRESDEHQLTSNYIYYVIASVKQRMKEFYGTACMLQLTFKIPILWFLSAIIYFGVPLNTNSFTKNPYLYIIIIGAAEFPVAFLGPLLINYFGNIKTGIVLYLITGGCMLGTLLVTDNVWYLRWIFTMLSVNSSGAIISICGLLISELFPTVLRATGWGMSFCAYYIGFFLCSFINSTIFLEIWWAFNTTCGICCVIAAILISLLPETHGQKLSETINDVNNRGCNCQRLNI